MSTSYQGTGQPAASSGGFLDGLLGTSTPAYVGTGQTSSGSSGGGFLSGLFGGETPAYQAAPSQTNGSMQTPQPCPELDPDIFGSGPIAIVIPRQG
jgi:hypothetical protein